MLSENLTVQIKNVEKASQEAVISLNNMVLKFPVIRKLKVSRVPKSSFFATSSPDKRLAQIGASKVIRDKSPPITPAPIILAIISLCGWE